MCVNWLYFLLQAIVVDGSPSKQISCKYLNGTPLGEQLVSLTVAYVDIDFSKYRPQSKNISEQRMFFLQYQDGPDSWLNLTKEVFGEP
jgi:hypothetical protein